MYLKALEIQGFKSFPDKTVLQFGEDITAIVGPNGSGKSNISDAIRWVMGEQSTKNLRGAKMEDVIFGGTEKRSPVGFAQVTLILDNSGHIFPNVEQSEVMVTRRYFRSGESEYYINKQSVRLRDVNELFMDTGLGREGYSIIGQGRIDEILSVKSSDRREIFEEAAGISRFRHRKEESERKLERTEENLVRINDKIAELELQVEPLRQQAETAKQFLIYRDELRLLEISVWLDSIDSLKQQARKLETDFSAAQAGLDQANQALEQLYRSSEGFGQRTRENDMEQERLRRESGALDGQIGEEESAVAVLETTLRHNEETIRSITEELSSQSSRRAELEAQAVRQRSRIEEIEKQAGAVEQELSALLEKARAAADSAGSAAQEAEQLRSREALALSAAAQAETEQSALAASIMEMAQRRKALEEEMADARRQVEEKTAQRSACRRSLEDAEEAAQSAANVIKGHTLKLEALKKRDSEAAEQKLQLTMDHSAMQNRAALLGEMEKEYEGFHKAVRLVMQAAEKHTLQGVHGPIASLIRTDDRYAVAMEIALGAGMQNIVVDREEDAKRAIQYLKQRDGGRATFLPLSAIRGDLLRERGLETEFGFVGIAAELVTYDKTYENIFRSLLGRTVVAEDLDCGIAMARKYQNRFRIVTLDGQVINRGGSMTGGSVSRSAGILSRANELSRLKGRLEKMAGRLEEADRTAEEARRELTAAQYALEVAEGQRRQAEDAVLRLRGEKGQFDVVLQTLEDSLAALEAEKETLGGRAAEAAAGMEEKAQEKKAREAEAAELRRQAAEQISGQSELMTLSSSLHEQVADSRSRLAALSAEREAVSRSVEDLERLCRDLSGDQAAREQRIASYQAASRQAEEEIRDRTSHIASLRQKGEQLRQQLDALAEEKLRIEQERTAADKELRSCNDTVLAMQQEVSRLEQKRAANAMEESQLLDKLWEHYELSHSAAMEQRIELESTAKANRRIGELKREIGRLGNVNVGAIEEFDRVNTRYTYLTEQRDDVDRAKRELIGVIDSITGEMRDIFAQQFTLINASFQTTFTELFGGGKATLELEDPNDILNCGIEIKVQPPGKALKTITLLSGGEKAFVAIALYFAILKVHPTPFCVMDEIEAALDEANVVRFAKYMRTLSDKTQFIVITHRRGTMEEADVLYGVTMQERGVSKMLTINMSELAKELKIQ